jgi:hypothetical protein
LNYTGGRNLSIYSSVCPTVRFVCPSVHPSVRLFRASRQSRPSVRLSITK